MMFKPILYIDGIGKVYYFSFSCFNIDNDKVVLTWRESAYKKKTQ
jgi:hypothetical protein